jgi:NAD+ synthase
MTESFLIALAQLNPHVGNIIGNMKKLRAARAELAMQKADLLVTSELFVCGYPPEDLVRKPALLDLSESAIRAFAAETGDGGPAVLLGAPWRDNGKLYNAVLLIDGGRIQEVRAKCELPNYGPFDEKRVFDAGPLPKPVTFKGVKLGLPICEDIWFSPVCNALKEAGAEMLVAINGSPFDMPKRSERECVARQRVKETGLPLLYLNQVGGQDELVFDGGSFVLDRDGSETVSLPEFRESLVTTAWLKGARYWTCKGPKSVRFDGEESVWRALAMGISDYVSKNGFSGVVLGLSGGIDSAIVAALAVDALGADKVHAVMMPSPYTSQDSLDDAAAIAEYLSIRLDQISIEPIMLSYRDALSGIFAGRAADTAEENIQARARGAILMAISNKLGSLLLSTGNKSEMSVGYATLYGDMCGGFAAIKDVYKTSVFALSCWRNKNKPKGLLGPPGLVMPERVITKPPTAELKPNQTDQDTLPPYDTLDAILLELIENERSVTEVAAQGYPEPLVHHIWKMLDRAEYKRRQAAPGVKITKRNFGRDRRYPITNALVTAHELDVASRTS